MSEDEISSAGEALRQAMLDALREIETRFLPVEVPGTYWLDGVK